MRYYIIRDLQGCDFCGWTWEEPQTRAEILKLFREFAHDEKMGIERQLNLGLITEVWDIEICPVDMPVVKCPECKCPMRKDKCPNCGKEWFITI